MYRERLVTRQETHFATNIGGGVKIRLVGPLRVRADYRVFRLQGDPLHETYQRFYVGAQSGVLVTCQLIRYRGSGLRLKPEATM